MSIGGGELVLVVDDAPAIQRILRAGLEARGYRVAVAETGRAGVEAVAELQPAVVVLDLGLPDVDGVRVLGMIREVSAVPVIVATARDDEAEMVRVLDRGADDYVVKPFSAEQLDARVRAVLRRSQREEEEPALVVGGLVVDRSAREATLDGQPLDLTRVAREEQQQVEFALRQLDLGA